MTCIVRSARIDDALGIAAVHIASWQTSYRDIIADAYLKSLSLEERTRLRHDVLQSSQGAHFVAVDPRDDRVVGFCDAGRCREADPEIDGEIYAIYLLESHKRLGLGKRLIGAAFAALQTAGHRNCIVWALEQNARAHAFYEACGGHRGATMSACLIGGVAYPEVSYHFDLHSSQ